MSPIDVIKPGRKTCKSTVTVKEVLERIVFLEIWVGMKAGPSANPKIPAIVAHGMFPFSTPQKSQGFQSG